MKRILRIAWVLAANAFVVSLTISRLSPEIYTPGTWDVQVRLEFILEIFFPILAIVSELLASKFAKWANIGCFALAGGYWLTEALWWRSDPFFGVLLITGVGFLILAGITEIIYRRTQTRNESPTIA
jgi:hypothetical protein